MIDIGLAGALIGGMLSLFSPCSVVLLPAFFAVATSAGTKRLGRIGVFYLGLCTSLVPLGVLAGSLGSVVTDHRRTIMLGAGLLMFVLGVVQIGGWSLPGVAMGGGGGDPAASGAVFLMGSVYGLTGACAGPLLGSVLTLAALGGDPLYGGIVLAVFGVGMVAPLAVIALLWSRWPTLSNRLRPRTLRIGPWDTTVMQLIGGLFMIGVGVFLIWTRGESAMALLSARDQFRLERTALRWVRPLDDWMVVLFALGLLAVMGAVRRWGTGGRGRREGHV